MIKSNAEARFLHGPGTDKLAFCTVLERGLFGLSFDGQVVGLVPQCIPIGCGFLREAATSPCLSCLSALYAQISIIHKSRLAVSDI